MHYKMFKPTLLCLLGLISLVYADNYEILLPKIARPGNQFGFSFSTFAKRRATYECDIGMRTLQGVVLVEKTFALTSDSSAYLTLDIPEQISGDNIEFYAKSDRKFVINISSPITVNRKVQSVYIQTDKGLYKQGQKVNFRVISFDQNLKALDETFDITIKDSADNLIKQLTKKNSTHGVITDELQLSDPAVQGDWTITATSRFSVVKQTFTVAEYVLPKFEVTVKLPSFFHLNLYNPALQEDLIVTILAKYTYGKPVEGVANVLVKLYSWWYAEEQPVIKKTLLLTNGKADLVLTLTEIVSLLPSRQTVEYLRWQTLYVEASVTETLTGITLKGENTVPIKPHVYQLEFLSSSPSNFKPGLDYETYIRILRSDGTQPAFKDSESKEIDVEIITVYENFVKPSFSKTVKLNVSQEGIARLQFETEADFNRITMEASYFEEVSKATINAHKLITKFETRDNNLIRISLLNENKIIKPGTQLRFEVTTGLPSRRFKLDIVSKGNMLCSNHFVEAEKTTHYVKINVTQELATQWAPEARFVVTFVTADNELVADSLALDVIDYMANKIELVFDKNQTEPGEKVNLKIKSGQNSFVALLAVDQSVLLLDEGNDITQNKVANELITYDNQYFSPYYPSPLDIRCFGCGGWPIWPGGSNTKEVIEKSGLQYITDLFVKEPEPVYYLYAMADAPVALEAAEASSGSSGSIKIRKNFPETFIWSEAYTDSEGEKVLNLTVPDTITSWVATGFSMSPEKGLGVTKESTKLGVIKPLFVSLVLPYSIIRGEEFVLQANVFNYFNESLPVGVTLVESEYFKVIDCTTRNVVSKNVTKEIQAEKDRGTPVYFWIVPQALGHIPIQVRAIAPTAGDAVEVTLLVKPEGQPQSYSVSELIQLNSTQNFSKSYAIDLPSKDVLVEGSVQIEVTVVGDLMGSTLSNIEDLLKMPYGCGEQNLLGFAPDVYILEYLQQAGRLTEVIKNKGLIFITEGYQRQLTYQRTDGSFSAFGKTDKAGSTWLSAFTIKCFHQAKSFIPVEDEKISKTLKWILGNQVNGTFVEPPGGRVIHTSMQGGASKGIAMTAYVLISILENKNNSFVSSSLMQTGITEAVTYLENTYSSYSNNSYVLAIVSYAFYKAGSPRLEDVLNLLNEKAIVKDGLKYWESKPETSSDTWRSRYGRPTSYGVELASYVLLVYAQQKDINNALPIAKWLLTQRNAFGGFASTQDTVLGLEALASFASLLVSSSSEDGIIVSVTSDADGRKHDFDPITQQNSLVLQSVQLPESTTTVQVDARQAGVALVQLIVTYNTQSNDTNEALSLTLSTESLNDTLSLNISTSWNSTKESGMVVVEVNILTGYEVENKDEIGTQIGNTFKKIEEAFQKIVIYLDELTEEGVSFNVVMKKVIPVTHVKPALVKVYRYYDTEDVASSYYTADTQLTWDGACPQCCITG